MSAPPSGSANGTTPAGYYPDPSIPGYIRFWDGAAWVPGTSRPEPRSGEPLPQPPPGVTLRTPPREETGPVFFDEEPQAASPDMSPAPPAPSPSGGADRASRAAGEPAAADPPADRPEPASAWRADADRQGGFGGVSDRRVSWGSAAPEPRGESADPRGGWTSPPAPRPASSTPGSRAAEPRAAARPAGPAALPAGSSGSSGDGGAGGTEGADRPAGAASGGAAGARERTTRMRRDADRPASPSPAAPAAPAAQTSQADAAGSVPSPRPTPAAPTGPTSSAPAPGGPAATASAAPAARPEPAPGPERAGAEPQPAPTGWAQQVRELADQAPAQGGRGGAPGRSGRTARTARTARTGRSGPGGEAPAADGPVTPWKPPVDDPFLRSLTAQARPAGLGRRLVARLIDSLVPAAAAAAVAAPLLPRATDHIQAKVDAAEQAGVTREIWLLDATTAGFLAMVLGTLLIAGVLYEALPTARWGCSLGKKLCGVRVLDLEAQTPPGFGAALLRWLLHATLAVLVVGVVNMAWCLFDRPWRQCWHDKAARTFVARAGTDG
ncbi:RDD family protein [Streptomyces sp. 549]|uniref:RDD family protein n=1 Tax=Streptomyces sp. 549 TaxID=3049076 RepID=UPI0024C20C88|nr:RDD family protein [Streptomyces sp. 549]MDK1473795.1 RDD family protein [Streptomyces sp. 549]